MPSMETSSTSDSSTRASSGAAAAASVSTSAGVVVSGMRASGERARVVAADASGTGCHGQPRAVGMAQDGRVTETGSHARADLRARIEQAALDLFTLKGFEQVTVDDVAIEAGTSRRTFFRSFATKADAVWGDFGAHVARLERLLDGPDDGRPVLHRVCAAYVEVN